jgi:hypothetical protein
MFQIAVVDHDHLLRLAFVEFAVVGRVLAGATHHDAVPEIRLPRDREGLVGQAITSVASHSARWLVGDAGLKFGHDRERMHPEPLLDEAAVPESMQTLARAAPGSDVIAAPVVPGRSVEGLVDVAHPMTEELERRQLLLVCRVGRCQDREVVPDRAHNALFGQRALMVIKAGWRRAGD